MGEALLAFSNVQKITSYDFTSSLLHHRFGWISSFVLTASSSVTTRQSLNKFISALAVSSVLAMAMTEQAHHCSSGLTKTLDFSICSVTMPASRPYKSENTTLWQYFTRACVNNNRYIDCLPQVKRYAYGIQKTYSSGH